ncbi:hypothetical protein [Spirosoma spitsbergense]|uniref:hypothetical protein n=1 Tax=Spirosoma spitsbergense TaxID=431554 RepID=UPI00036A6425|nr:hypothetical protein [Spirosoma spitsbergense]
MTTLISEGSRVRVTIERGGLHIRNYYATVIRWSKSGKLYVKSDSGMSRLVSAESCKLIKA